MVIDGDAFPLVNIPLNNRLQTFDIPTLDGSTQRVERQQFEARWNRWNTIRTIFATAVSLLLLTALTLV